MQAIVFGLLFNSLAAQTPVAHTTDRDRAGMVGNVRSVLMEIAPVERYGDRAVEGKRFGTTVTRYDERGNLTERVIYSGDRIIERAVYSYDADGSYTMKRYFAERASSDGASKSPPPAPFVTRCAVKYDADGNLTEETCTGAEGKGQERTEYKFDKSGGVLQQSATRRAEPYFPMGAPPGTVVVEVTVDEKGKAIAARAISGPQELRGASEQAARGWEFKPTTLSGVPVKVIGTITFNFIR